MSSQTFHCQVQAHYYLESGMPLTAFAQQIALSPHALICGMFRMPFV
jgi:hypothetical protein